jgi:hypothetical protein
MIHLLGEVAALSTYCSMLGSHMNEKPCHLMKSSPAAVAKGVISFDTNSTACFVTSKNLKKLTYFFFFFLISTLTELKLVMVVWPILHLCLMRF